MIIYIAGKMTGLPDLGREHFKMAERRLKKAGHTVLNPAILPDTLPKDAYLPICLAMIDAADSLYMLSGWEDSRGARLERDYAGYQGKLIGYEEEAEV